MKDGRETENVEDGGKGKSRKEENKGGGGRGGNIIDYMPSTTVCCQCFKTGVAK